MDIASFSKNNKAKWEKYNVVSEHQQNRAFHSCCMYTNSLNLFEGWAPWSGQNDSPFPPDQPRQKILLKSFCIILQLNTPNKQEQGGDFKPLKHSID